MKKILLFLLIMQVLVPAVSGQGKFAGAVSKKLIGKKYNNDRVLPGMTGYQYREASLASGIEDPEQFTVAVFQRGTTYIVLFGINVDSTSDDYTILDVLEIKNVKSNQAIKTLLCRKNGVSDAEIVGVTKPGSSEFSTATQAWRFNRNKRRFETMTNKGIDCMNEGDD